MDLIDEFVGTSLEVDDAAQILSVGRAKMGGALDTDVRETEKQIGKFVVLGGPEKACDGTW
jgi:hypothetical protein